MAKPDKIKRTPCPVCGHGHVVWIGTQSVYHFVCDGAGCDWTTESGKPGNPYKREKFVPKSMTPPVKKTPKFQPDPPELVEAIRKECARRMEILKRERAKFPPTNVMRVKGKTKTPVPNRNFTKEMREHMHEYAFTAEDVREELKKKFTQKGH